MKIKLYDMKMIYNKKSNLEYTYFEKLHKSVKNRSLLYNFILMLIYKLRNMRELSLKYSREQIDELVHNN